MPLPVSDIWPKALQHISQFSRLPLILQTEAAESGFACLAMVASYHGYKTDLTMIRRKFSIPAQGATLSQIMKVANKLELSCRTLKLDLCQLRQLDKPYILHWELKHFVVLKKVTTKTVVIHDPAIGERVLSHIEVSDSSNGIALELNPTSEFKKGQDRSNHNLSHFWSHIISLKRNLLQVLMLSLLLPLFAVVSPFYMQTLVDDFIQRADFNLLSILALGFALLLAIDAITSFIRQNLILNLSNKLNIKMVTTAFQHFIRLPMDYFSKRHMGDLVSRFESLKHIQEQFTAGVLVLLADSAMAMITLIVMFMYHVKLTLVVLGVVMLQALLCVALYRPLRVLNEGSIVATTKEKSHFMESLRGIQSVKVFEQESVRQKQWQNRFTDSMSKNIQISHWEIRLEAANKILFGIENSVIIYFAAVAVTENILSVGMLYAFISYKNRFIGAMNNLISQLIGFRMLDIHFNRLADITHSRGDKQLSGGVIIQDALPSGDTAIQGEIEIRDVTFSFGETGPNVFRNVSMLIKAGEMVAIVGPSGSGKSALLKCMMGLSQPSKGQILIDNKPLQMGSNYQGKIAAVMQNDQLLSGSIAENIACFDSQINIQKVVFSANAACVHEEIMGTDMHYNTLVGDMGTSLSGGQKQRIMLARALYKNAQILFIDGVTSHLDAHNESQINEQIKKLSITRVIVTNRPETIAMADRVFQLACGRLIEITHKVNTATPLKI